MAGPRLRHLVRVAVAAVDHLQQVPTGRAAQRLRRHVADRQDLDRLGEQIGKPLGRAHAQLAADGPVAVLAEVAGDLTEVFASLQARRCLLDALLALRNDIGCRAFGHGHQNLRQIDLVGRGRFAAALVEHAVDVGIGDADAGEHLAFTHPLDHQLVAQGAAETTEIQAFVAQPVPQLNHADLVLRGDVGDRAVDFGLVDFGTTLAGVGDLHPLVDQRVEHLLAQALGIGQRAVVAFGLALRPFDALRDLDRGDRFGVDHRHDEVTGLDDVAICLGLQRAAEQAGGHRQDQNAGAAAGTRSA